MPKRIALPRFTGTVFARGVPSIGNHTEVFNRSLACTNSASPRASFFIHFLDRSKRACASIEWNASGRGIERPGVARDVALVGIEHA
jgi:hypothetical protein